LIELSLLFRKLQMHTKLFNIGLLAGLVAASCLVVVVVVVVVILICRSYKRKEEPPSEMVDLSTINQSKRSEPGDPDLISLRYSIVE